MDLSSEMIHSLLPVFMTVTLGASVALVGVVEGVAEATSSVTKVFSGWISDRLGRRKLLAGIGYGLAALSKPLFPIASSVPLVLAARFADRVGKGIRGAPRDALIADITTEDIRGAAFGLRQALDTIGAFLGPAAAILFMAILSNNVRLVFALAVIPALASVALLVLGVSEPDSTPKPTTSRSPIIMSELKALGTRYWAVVALATAFSLARFSEAFLVLRGQTDGLHLALAPLVMILMNIVYAATAAPFGALSDRIDRRILLALGLVALIAADLVLSRNGGVVPLLIGVGLWGLHLGLTQGLFAALVANTAPEALRGTAFGMYNLITGMALMAASIAAGALWAAFGAPATFLTGAAIAAITLFGVFFLRERAG